jgi:DNA helicase IV
MASARTDSTAAIQEEQRFLDRALIRHAEIVDHLLTEAGAAPVDEAARARARTLRQRYREMSQARDGLIFGRLDAQDGTIRHIGRIGVQDADDAADPLVVDWRADAARPFYTATALNSLGPARRRHLQVSGSAVTGVDDEPLDGAVEGELVGEGALLNALGQRRTGQMTTAIATLQREQDDIIRAAASAPLIVQGGPGTGKTVVALHRVAYLLFSHRQMAEQAVLMLGPSPRFLDYIAQVLPALGETAVVSATCETLLPGISVTRNESRHQSEIKGRALWQGALANYIASQRPSARELRLRWEGEEYVISAAKVGQSLTAVSGHSYHDARKVFTEQLRQILADAVIERREAMLVEVEAGFEDILARFSTGLADSGSDVRGAEADGEMSEDEVEELRERIAGSAVVSDFVVGWWPDLDPEPVLARLLHSKELLRENASQLTEDEISGIVAEPEGWSASDLPLLDAVSDLLGESSAAGQGVILLRTGLGSNGIGSMAMW